MLNHGGLHRSSNSNMDLEPSAPYASASSFPSPAEFQNGEEPSVAYEKLQQICEGGTSSTGSLFPKFPFTVSAPSKGLNLGIDVTSKVFPPPPLPQSFQPFCPPVVSAVPEKRLFCPHFSQSKIAYRNPGTGVGSPSTSTLQGILHKCGITTTPAALDTEPIKQLQHADSLARPSSSRIMEKIRSLDDMLRGLEHYSAAKRFTSDVRREPEVKADFHRTGHRQSRPSESLEVHLSDQRGTAAFGVNKALSRLEFKAQMDKLTGVIEDRWFYGGSGKIETKSSVATDSFLPARNDDFHTTPQDMPNSASNPLTSFTSIHLLEEMLRRVAGLERRLTKRHRHKQSKQKGVDARVMLRVQRPARKRMVALLQMQFRQYAASINQRLDKTDLAIKSLRRQHVKDISYHNNGPSGERYLGHVNGDGQPGSLASAKSRKIIETGEAEENFGHEEWVEDQDTISRNIQLMADELCTLRNESQYMSHTLEKVQKLHSEHSVEIELCWTAINHLCMDNDTFRGELRTYHTSLQNQQESSHHTNEAAIGAMQNIRDGQGETILDSGQEM